MKIGNVLSTILSALIKIALAVWVINFIYTKTLEAYEFGFAVFTEEAIAPAPGRDVTVSFTEDKSNLDLAKILEEKGLVRDYKLAFVQILASEYRESIEPGVYTLNTSMTTEEMMAAMVPAESEEPEEEEE